LAGLGLRRAAHLEKLGHYEDAEAELARRFGRSATEVAGMLGEALTADLLYVRSIVLFNLDDLDGAERQIGTGLEILGYHPEDFDGRYLERLGPFWRGARERERAAALCDLLERRCLVQKERAQRPRDGDGRKAWRQAELSAWLGSAIARRLGDPIRLGIHMLNWSWLALDRQRYRIVLRRAAAGLTLTREVSRTGIASSSRIGVRELEAGFLHRLAAAWLGIARDGPAEGRASALREAESQADKGLGTARSIGHCWYEALLGVELGRVHLAHNARERLPRAVEEFRTALIKASGIRAARLEGCAQAGLTEALGCIWGTPEADVIATSLQPFDRLAADPAPCWSKATLQELERARHQVRQVIACAVALLEPGAGRSEQWEWEFRNSLNRLVATGFRLAVQAPELGSTVSELARDMSFLPQAKALSS
jgi:hypothetical protein